MNYRMRREVSKWNAKWAYERGERCSRIIYLAGFRGQWNGLDGWIDLKCG
jgi:hypothetical protein